MPLRGLWQHDAEVEAANRALERADANQDLEALARWIADLCRLAIAADREAKLSIDWHSPMAKLRLPLLLGITRPDQFWIGPETLVGCARDTFSYCGPTFLHTVAQFEPHRTTIESMWRANVMMEEMPNRPGGVQIRPMPKVPPIVPLTEIIPNTVVLGTDLLTGETSRVGILDLTHTLIVGTAGFGKSVFLHQLITQLLVAGPEMVEELILIDLKGGVEFIAYTESSNRVRAVWKYADVLDTIEHLICLMEERQAEMLQRRWRLFEGRRVFLIIDEFAQIQLYPFEGKDGKAAHDRLIANLNRLSMLGRAMGIVIVAAIQKATSDGMDSSFKMNLQGVVCFRVPSRMMASQMLPSLDDLRFDPVLLPRGRYIYYDPTSGTTRYLQAHVAAG